MKLGNGWVSEPKPRSRLPSGSDISAIPVLFCFCFLSYIVFSVRKKLLQFLQKLIFFDSFQKMEIFIIFLKMMLELL